MGDAGPTPVRVTLHMRVLPGREADFEDAWRRVAAATSHADGNLRQALARDGHGEYVITSDWVSREAFGAYERSDSQDVLTAPLRALRASARMDIADLIVQVDRASPARRTVDV
jgi:heme-degrading monooxygenase HmoA